MQFGLGVLAGIVATMLAYAIIYAGRYFIVTYVGYLLLERIFIRFPSPRNLSGIWETEFWVGDNSNTEIAKVSQLFGHVWGIIYFRTDGTLRKYKMKGNIKEGVLVATYEIDIPRETLDRGAYS